MIDSRMRTLIQHLSMASIIFIHLIVLNCFVALLNLFRLDLSLHIQLLTGLLIIAHWFEKERILFSYDFLDSWGLEIEKMNKNKKGKPFVFPNSFILVICYLI